MALQKQSVNINFSQGLDTKTDPNQIQIGKFLELENTIFQSGLGMQKRNGYGALTSLSASNLNTIDTFNGNLTVIGNSLYAFSNDSEQWINKGTIASVSLSVTPLVRSSSSQSTVDIAITTDGLCCSVWADSDGTSKYQITDSMNGQVIVASTSLETGAVLPRVFLIGNYFIITYLKDVAGTIHLKYVAISSSNVNITVAATDLSTQVSGVGAGYDGQVVDDRLFVAWNGSDGGGAVRITGLTNTLTQLTTVAIAGKTATKISICGDTTQGSAIVWLSYYDGTDTWSASFTTQLSALLASTKILTGISVINLTSFAKDNVNKVFYEVSNNYSYVATRSDFVRYITITSTGTIGTATTMLRGVGLTSKAFQINSIIYMLVTYGGAYQPTYFLIDESGNVVAKLAYANGGGYPSNQILSNSIVNGTQVSIGYLFKDLLLPVNKDTAVAAVGGIYTQTGINLAKFDLASKAMVSAEIGGSLHFASGFLWMYDGVKPVEHGFHLWPEDIVITTATVGGNLSAQIYYYKAVYEWTDSQGNIHRSAPSIAYIKDISGSVTATNTNTVNVPTYRPTYKTSPNSVRIVLYRWSSANQVYYQVTSIASPTLNSTTADSVAIVDTLADASIIGNPILYTTGGVIENIGAPACKGLALYKSRLMILPSENPNEIWESKQVIQGTPVETSDLLTTFFAPTTGAQGSTGNTEVISAMDDKFIAWKANAVYYMTGNGPDNTGANNDFTDPVFITSTVGCTNPFSLSFMPKGIMFQSNKGIWLLGRDLSTTYVGAPVELYNSETINSAITVPGTNQVRFTLDSGITLMYDYYYDQWGTFTNVPAISSTIYNGMHTYLDSYGRIFQETAGQFLDGSRPVLMRFKTGWLNIAGIQGFVRAYFFYLLGNFISPHKLQLQIAYDYNPAATQVSTIIPDNYSTAYGGDSLYGSSSPFGGPSNVEQDRVFLEKQKCQALQITLNEVFDSSYGTVAGEGFTLSGINLIVGGKGSYPRLAPKYSVG